MTHPRVLFVTGAAFNRITGGGITFTNLFAGWPKESLACVHDDPVPPTDETCDRYYRLGSAEIRAWGPLERFRGPAIAGASQGGTAQNPPASRRFLMAAKKVVFGDSLPQIGLLSPQLERWIAEFRPQVLYTILGGNGMMELIEAIRTRFDLPVAVHVMDDWVEAHHRKGLLASIERRRMLALVRRAMDTATCRMAIGDTMAEEYGARYGKPFVAFQNTVDCARWAGLAKADPGPVGTPIRVLYTGSILPFAQLDALADCCRAIAALAAEGVDIALDIHSPPFLAEPVRERLCVAPNIRLQPPITDDDSYFRTLAEADILLLPVNFDHASTRFIRLSMPTKVPSYLVAGTPTLVYGPDNLAQVDYARDCGWGLVVDRQDPALLMDGLRRLVNDAGLRRRLSETARRLAAERHDARVVRAAFQKALTGISRGERQDT